MFCRSISLRNSSRRLETDFGEIPSPVAISLGDQPCEIGIATKRRVAVERDERLIQSISSPIDAVDRDEPGELAVDDAVAGLESSATTVGANPIDAPKAKGVVGVRGEAHPARLVPFGEFPRCFDEVRVELFEFVARKVEAASPGDVERERLDVMDVNTYQAIRSSPIDFTIPASSSVVGLKTHSYHYLRLLSLEARWRSNVSQPVVQASLSTRTGRRVWSVRRREYNSLGSQESTSFDWYVPRRIKAGTRLNLLIKVGAASLRRVVRAP